MITHILVEMQHRAIHRQVNYCLNVEYDAKSIAAEIADYLSIPTHTQISTDDITYKSPKNNTFTVTATDPSITITITDSSGKCSLDIQESRQGWDDNGVFTEIMEEN